MNMQKQKPIWSKILAMLCALALCISMVPAASAAPGQGASTSNVNKVTMGSTGINGFATLTEDITESSSITEDNVTFSLEDSVLVMMPSSGNFLPKTVTVYAQADYQPTITVTSGNGVTFTVSYYGDNWWMITISLANTTANEVILNAEAVPTYTVTVNEATVDAGYTLIKGSSDTVKQGENYQFYVIPKTGYQAPNVTVTRGGSASESVTPEDGTGLYKVSDIQSNITITIGEAQFQQYTVNFVSGDEYSFEGANNTTISNDKATVNYGGSVSFKVKLNGDYDNSNVIVYANGSKLAANAGVYTIERITVNQTVSVTGVEKNKYTVTLPENTDGYYITTVNPTVVESGGQFTFNVVVNPGYDADNVSVTADNNQTVTNTSDNSYTISNITADTTISISGIVAAQYNVTTSGSNATVKVDETAIDDNYQASYGILTFTVTPDAGYKVDSVKVDGNTPQHNSDGSYTISVTAPVKIVVTTSPLADITLFTTVTHAELKLSVQTTSTLSDLYSDDIYIIAYGTLYAKDQFDSNALKSKIIEHIDTSNMVGIQVSNEPLVYNYCRGNLNISLAGIAGKTITFSDSFNNVNLSNEDNRYGAGWIALQQGEQTWIITSSTASLNP